MKPAVIGLAILVAAAPAGAQRSYLGLDQTVPEHLRGSHKPPLMEQPIPEYTAMVMPRAVYSLPDGIASAGKPDAKLSNLCRKMAFVQKVDRYYWARTKKRNYGVAFPTGGSLVDLKKSAKAGKVYFFDVQDSDCTVYVGDIVKLMPHYLRN